MENDLRSQFETMGYVVLPNFKSPEDIVGLKQRALEIVTEHEGNMDREVFQTDKSSEQSDKTSNDYFLNSDNSIRCFFEPDAFDGTGNLRQAHHLSINKIGHALHDLDPLFEAFSTGDALNELASTLGMSAPQIWQSMYIFKQPRIGGQVDWHQDGSFFYTDPLSVITFWFALEDATMENGCLWVEPKGHKGPLRERFLRDGRHIEMKALTEKPWPDMADARPLEVKAGTLVCFHGRLPHYSAPNTSENARHAYTLHVTDAKTAYDPANWIQRPDTFPARGFLRN